MSFIMAASVCSSSSVADGAQLLFQGLSLNKFHTLATAEQIEIESGPAKGLTAVKSEMLSPELAVPQEFDQLVVSWNAQCSKDAFITIESRAKIDDKWTKWYQLGYWAQHTTPVARTSTKGQKDGNGDVDTDTLTLTKKSKTAQVRVGLYSTTTDLPTVSLIACDFSLSSRSSDVDKAKSRSKPIVLDVPEISQRSYPPKGDVWCSPTSVTMVLNYWVAKQKNSKWKKDVYEVAPAIYDEAWGGTGNWTFNTAYAGSLPGMTAYCRRFNSFQDVERWISNGVPVVLSISANTLHGNGTPGGGGHLIVCVGFDENGDVIVNDPYATLDKGQRVRRTYKRDKLFQAWRSSLGMTYLIYPSDYSVSDL